jgi:hypothetical protein
MVLTMEIHSDSLIGLLLTCSFPLFLLAVIAVAILSARSRLKETSQMRRNLRERGDDQFLRNPRTRLAFRIMGGVGLFFSLVLLVVISLLIHSVGKAVGFDNRVYWFAIVIPFICSIA